MPQRRNYPFYQIVLMCALALVASPNATTGGDHSSQNKRNWCQGAELHAARP